MKEALLREDLNKQRGNIWIGRDGNSSSMAWGTFTEGARCQSNGQIDRLRRLPHKTDQLWTCHTSLCIVYRVGGILV